MSGRPIKRTLRGRAFGLGVMIASQFPHLVRNEISNLSFVILQQRFF